MGVAHERDHGWVRRIFTLSVAWLAAAIVAAVVPWQGVGLIGDQVTDHRDGRLTAAQIDAALAEAERGGIPIPPTTTTLPPTGDSSVAGTTPQATTAAGAGAGGIGTGTTPGRSTTPSRGTAPATGSNTGSGSGGQPSPASSAPAPAAVVKNYTVAGGTASISFAPDDVKVLWATPAPGFTVSSEPEGPGIRVEFESSNARSRIDAWWDGGPQDRVDENGGGPGSGSGGSGS